MPLGLDRVEPETIVTDPSPVAHLRILKARLVSKGDYSAPKSSEMRQLLGLPLAADGYNFDLPALAVPESEEDVVKEDSDGGEEVEVEDLLHANLLDRESLDLYKMLKGKQRELSPLSEQPKLSDTTSSLTMGSKHLIGEAPQSRRDVIAVRKQGRWFSAVVELGAAADEDAGANVGRHFKALRGEYLYNDEMNLQIVFMADALLCYISSTTGRPVIQKQLALHTYPAYQPLPPQYVRLPSNE